MVSRVDHGRTRGDRDRRLDVSECVVVGVARIPTAPRPIRRVVAVGCALAILLASVADPSEGVPRTLFGIGFTVYLHLLAYAGLAGYAIASIDRRTLVVAAALATLYGAAIELVQGTISYRTMSAVDALINAVGAAFGAGLWWRIAPAFDVEPAD
mgnify:CR=1 FL=1